MSADWAGSWERTTTSCGECSTVFAGCACPNCGERPGGSFAQVEGLIVPGESTPWLVTLTDGDVQGQPVTNEKAAWLQRSN